ncbi:MAG: hypothetical protein BGN89_16170 [Alphaproteobacteria bacterium 64-6]|nr:MAG: hypothetical protein BGN89_16170 [Alphaproteobacteria bacterium 64-6]
MSLRALPLIVIPFILYNIVVLFSGGAHADDVLRKVIFELPMVGGARWRFSMGDLLILVTMFMLFFELIKATYTASASLLADGLSMLVFIACLVEFLLVPQAATSVFFFIMIATLIDVVAGFMIGIRTARRDLNIGDH